jgi:hypothetical protein
MKKVKRASRFEEMDFAVKSGSGFGSLFLPRALKKEKRL